MDLFVSLSEKRDEVTIRAISEPEPDSGMVAELMTTITAGQTVMDIPFEAFVEAGSGKHTLVSLLKKGRQQAFP